MINKVALAFLIVGLTALTQTANAGNRNDDDRRTFTPRSHRNDDDGRKFTSQSRARHADLVGRNITPKSLVPSGDNAGNAPYADGWTTGDNGGTGFGAWTLTSAGGGGSFIGGTGQGASPSFGLFGGAGGSSSADRPFTGALTAGQTFSIDLGNTATVATGGEIGLNLTSGGVVKFTLKFVGGGSSWQLNDGGTDFGSGQSFAANTNLHFTLTYVGLNTYSYTFGLGSGTNFTSTNVNSIDGLRLFSNLQGAGENFGANNLAIVPEPVTVLLVGPALLGGMFFIRRRRA